MTKRTRSNGKWVILGIALFSLLAILTSYPMYWLFLEPTGVKLKETGEHLNRAAILEMIMKGVVENSDSNTTHSDSIK